MSEKSAQTKKKLASNADKITIAVLALIFAGLLYAWWQEQNSTLGSASVSGKPAQLQDQLAQNSSLQMLENMSAQPTLDSAPDIKRVAALNMFDFTTMQAEAQLEAQAQTQVQQAQALIDQKKVDEARPLLENAHKVRSYDPQVKTLLDQITTKSETAASPDGAPL